MTTVAHEPPRDRELGQRLGRWMPAIAVFGLGIAAWQWILPALGTERYLLPPFWDVLEAFWESRGELVRAGWIMPSSASSRSSSTPCAG